MAGQEGLYHADCMHHGRRGRLTRLCRRGELGPLQILAVFFFLCSSLVWILLYHLVIPFSLSSQEYRRKPASLFGLPYAELFCPLSELFRIYLSIRSTLYIYRSKFNLSASIQIRIQFVCQSKKSHGQAAQRWSDDECGFARMTYPAIKLRLSHQLLTCSTHS